MGRRRKGKALEPVPCVIYKYVFCNGRKERRYFTGFSAIYTNKPLWGKRSRAWEFKSVRESEKAFLLCKAFSDCPETIKRSRLFVPVRIQSLPDGRKAVVPVNPGDKLRKANQSAN